MMTNKIKLALQDDIKVKEKMLNDSRFLEEVGLIADTVIQSLRRGGCLFFAGNGGSAADAQHLAAELVGRYKRERRGFNAEALTVDTSILTSLSNDYDFNYIYERQLEGKARSGDVFFGFSTSGNSLNILKAAEYARKNGILVVGFTGKGGGKLAGLCDHLLAVPSDDTPHIQEAHITLGHILCDLIEEALVSHV
jgi:D-sedoheptulose 7-phosphate isomerase